MILTPLIIDRIEVELILFMLARKLEMPAVVVWERRLDHMFALICSTLEIHQSDLAEC